ncbi:MULTISPECIES: DUF6950 family protein [unclassified Sphingomonas]|uniref:DUF6950 family protein n=1 Tax=unclassified Sphingomonas TaxID=196159 RepID=UPI001F215857|nr:MULTISPECIES: hypothetical protein [unclassified Sphingomonas]
MMRDLAQRAEATQSVVDRFRARPFGWATAGTCIHLARAQMRALGHRPPPIPRFRSAIGARRALMATGHADLAGLLDSMLPRIAPAAMWVGDLALMRGDGEFDAIVVSAGRLMAGYHSDERHRGVVNIEAHDFIGAWRL